MCILSGTYGQTQTQTQEQKRIDFYGKERIMCKMVYDRYQFVLYCYDS